MATKLPMRFRILHLISTRDNLTATDIMRALQGEYGGEGQFKESIIEDHLASMRAVGMIQDAEITIDAGDQLLQKVKITPYGVSRLKYLPRSWNPA